MSATMTTTMTRTSFIIYTDESSTATKLGTPSPSSVPSTSTRLVIATAGDKENVDPLTGQIPSLEEQLAKKRKTGVLVAKLVVTTKAPQPELKKRKILSSSSSSNTRSRGDKKERKASGSKKSSSGSLSRVRQLTELPKVEEEDVQSLEAKAAQAEVDARCYDLTVMPLADVSEAYSPTSTIDDELIAAGEKLKAATISQGPSVERASSPAPSIPEHESAPTSSPPHDSTELPDFSTPERKRIYSAFTFSSPSPAGERYAVTRANNADRFSDLAFTLERTL